MMMNGTNLIVGTGKFRYKWIDSWVKVPVSESESSKENGRTHGVAVTAEGKVVIFHQANPAILIYNSKGDLVDSWGNDFNGAHGLCLIREDGEEFLWLTDEFSGKVVKVDLAGNKIIELARPDQEIYLKNKYSPTWVAVDEERFGGNGDVWVADGYGENYLHRYDKYGNYKGCMDGSEGKAGKFNCPHGIWIDRRKPEAELYIADRGNKRVQVYNLKGKYKRVFGEGILTCPCSFVSYKDKLIISELSAKLTILDINDEVIEFLGENEKTCSIPGWPDHTPELIIPGKFNSPHSAAIDRDGNIYIVEWIKGGRVTKLEKIS